MMKFLQVAIFAIALVASAHAISCNVGSATGTCPATDLGAAIDTCVKCVTNGVAVASGCSSSIATSCSTVKTACESAKGTYTSCTTANCNGCSPASALQVSAFLLLAALSAMFF
jgi:hypothetical protein